MGAQQASMPSRAEIVQALQMGGAHLAAGRLDYAATAARQVLRFAPKNADALHLLALVAQGKGDPATAEKLIGEALKHAPAHPNLLVNLANSQRDQGKRSEEHTSELQSLMRISYAVFCLKKKNTNNTQ